MNIKKELFDLKDEKYKSFTSSLIPEKKHENIIGVRMPALRELEKKMKAEERAAFLCDLPHEYHEENLLHAIIIGRIKDFDSCLFSVEEFLPYIDNWAVCDSLCPKALAMDKKQLLKCIKTWLRSDKTYTVRFGLKMIMTHFLDADFKEEYLTLAASSRTDEYYLSMMVAWLFATALAKQYDKSLPFIEKGLLDTATHNRSIRKAVESHRITAEQKAYLKTLKVKGE